MPEGTDFLYPFIEGDGTDPAALLTDLAASARSKWQVSLELCAATLSASEELLRTASAAMARSFDAGGRLFVFGNGGSATDAEGVVGLYTDPPRGRSLPARSLVSDQAVITALSNDVGFDKVFSRQLIAYSQPNDIAMGFSTSGNSANLIVAFAEATKRGLLTVGLAGIDGGQMAVDANLGYCIVARSQSVHRVQEAQAAVSHRLWEYVQEALSPVKV